MILDINTELMLLPTWKVTRYNGLISWYHHKYLPVCFRITPATIIFYSDANKFTVSLRAPLCLDAQNNQICDLKTVFLSKYFSDMPELFRAMERWQPKEFPPECFSWTISQKMHHLLGRR